MSPLQHIAITGQEPGKEKKVLTREIVKKNYGLSIIKQV